MVNKKLSDANEYAARAAKLGLSKVRILDHLFAFNRNPTEAERQPLLCGPLLTGKDFLFNY
jgi:hypothetical protein